MSRLPDRESEPERWSVELAQLERADIDPLAARAQLLAAQRRLAHASPALVRFERFEPWVLCALSAAHLIWAVLRTLSS